MKEKELKFNDEAVEPYIEELASLGIKEDYFDAEHLMKIQQLLKTKDMNSLEELEALRNSVCKLFLAKIDEQSTQKEKDRYQWTLNGVILVIDSRRWDVWG